MPIAGFRGSGLAWMVDILSGVLTGGNHAGKVKDPFDDFSGPQNIGHLFITFKTNLFVKNYTSRIKNNIKTIKRLPKIKGVKEINKCAQDLKWDISNYEIIHEPIENNTAIIAAKLASEQKIKIIVKGHIHTDVLMKEFL